ncbi:MAG: DUF2905 domain-containing protein [Betaproteobacteria bacterium]|nr:DUF2905 domain-containing protein [Betaproteobacteria bacterium]
MLKWVLTIIVAVLVISFIRPTIFKFARKFIGRETMPGDISITFFNRRLYLPFGSTLILSLLATGLYWFIR